MNLYTVPQNEMLVPKDDNGRPVPGWFKSNQMGKGAVALLMCSNFVQRLLISPQVKARLQLQGIKGSKGIDNVVARTAKTYGYKEYCHYPSLCQHEGLETTVGNHWKKPSTCFYPEMNVEELLCSTTDQS
jgi:hypothetical protein